MNPALLVLLIVGVALLAVCVGGYIAFALIGNGIMNGIT